MILTALGVALWWAAHLFKRVAPGPRAAMGDPGKGLVALALLGAIVLMWWGYRSAAFVPVWTPPAWAVHANNTIMLLSVAMVGAGHAKARIANHIRHPMLWGFLLWSLAHLLVNGDLAAIILFGGLGAWAVVSMLVLNGTTTWVRSTNPPVNDLRLVGGTLVIYAVIAALHWYIGGVWPFAGGMG